MEALTQQMDDVDLWYFEAPKRTHQQRDAILQEALAKRARTDGAMKALSANVKQFINMYAPFKDMINPSEGNELYEFQAEAIAYLVYTGFGSEVFGARLLLNHVQGAGKTLTSICMARMFMKCQQIMSTFTESEISEYNNDYTNLYPDIFSCINPIFNPKQQKQRVLVIANGTTMHDPWEKGFMKTNAARAKRRQGETISLQLKMIRTGKDVEDLIDPTKPFQEEFDVFIIPKSNKAIFNSNKKKVEDGEETVDIQTFPLKELCDLYNIQMIILDEIHTMMGKVMRNNIMKAMQGRRFGIALSGTPLMNRPTELPKMIGLLEGENIKRRNTVVYKRQNGETKKFLNEKLFKELYAEYIHVVPPSKLKENNKEFQKIQLKVSGFPMEQMVFRTDADFVSYNAIINVIKSQQKDADFYDARDLSGEPDGDDVDDDDTFEGVDKNEKVAVKTRSRERTIKGTEILKKLNELKLFTLDPRLRLTEPNAHGDNAWLRKRNPGEPPSYDEAIIPSHDPSVKSRFILELLKTKCADDDKVVIAGVSVVYLGVLSNILHANGHNVYSFVGNTKLSNQISVFREGATKTTQYDELTKFKAAGPLNEQGLPKTKKSILLLGIQAGAEGIRIAEDGVMHQCSSMIFAELWWNKAKIAQTIARIYRPGQSKNVNVYFPYFSNGIEASMKKMIEAKTNNIQNVLAIGTAKQMSLEEADLAFTTSKLVEELEPISEASILKTNIRGTQTGVERILYQSQPDDLLHFYNSEENKFDILKTTRE